MKNNDTNRAWIIFCQYNVISDMFPLSDIANDLVVILIVFRNKNNIIQERTCKRYFCSLRKGNTMTLNYIFFYKNV